MYKPIMYYSVMTSNRGDMAIRKSITEAIEERIDVPFAYLDLKYQELDKKRIEKQLNTDCSALMIAGSGLYTNYSMSSGWYFPCKTELFEKIKVPIILIGIGNNQNLKGNILNSELKEETKQSIKLINDLAGVSSVRDQRTNALLLNLGVTKHRLMLDPGNFLRVKPVPKKRKVAIQIAQHAPILGRFDGTPELRTYNVNSFAKIATYLIKKEYEVVFIAHDALESSLIVDLQKIEPRIQYLNIDNLDVMLQEYRECQFTISMKMHSAIMAFSAGTPAIQVYYDRKQTEYLQMINCEEFGVNVFTDYYEDLERKVDMMLDHFEYYTKHIMQIRNHEQPKFDNLIDNICNIVKG